MTVLSHSDSKEISRQKLVRSMHVHAGFLKRFEQLEYA